MQIEHFRHRLANRIQFMAFEYDKFEYLNEAERVRAGGKLESPEAREGLEELFESLDIPKKERKSLIEKFT